MKMMFQKWLKHAVDTEDTEFFPMASGCFKKKTKSRDDLLTEFFQKELNDVPYESEKKAKLLEILNKLAEEEWNETTELESVEEVKRRVHTMLKEIEDKRE
jgi:hypothetical protein